MDTVRLIGALHPKGALITATIPHVQWVWEEANKTLVFRTHINNSVVVVECDIDVYTPEAFGEIYKRSSDLARTATNLACFQTGDGVSLVFDTFMLPDGTPSTLRLRDPRLDGLAKSMVGISSDQAKLDRVSQLVVQDPALFAALNDLIEVNAIPHIGPLNAGRVVDSLRRLIAPTLDTKPGWRELRRALNVSRDYIQLVTDLSTGPRHGDRTFISGHVGQEAHRRAWILMDRYIAYRLSGEDLKEPEFPELL